MGIAKYSAVVASQVLSHKKSDFKRPIRREISTYSTCVSVSPYTWVKQDVRSAMHAGNYTVWSMEFSLMDKCPVIRRSGEEMTPSTRSSVRQEQENPSPELCLSIWSRLL